MNNTIKEFLDLLESFHHNIIYLFNHQGDLLSNKKKGYSINSHTVNKYLNMVSKDKSTIEDIKNKTILQGVYFFNELYGFIAIQGDYKEVKPIINVLKDSLEIKLLYEHEMREKGINNQILNLLLNLDQHNSKKLNTILNQADINLSVYNRILGMTYKEDVYIQLKSNYKSKNIFIAHNNTTIYIAFENKIMGGNEKKHSILDEIRSLIPEIKKIYISGQIENLSEYKDFHKKMKFIKESIKVTSDNVLVEEYIDYYLLNFIPREEIEKLIEKIIQSNYFDREIFMETFPILIENNYNVAKSSKMLFLHENTIRYRLNNIKDNFNLDPLKRV